MSQTNTNLPALLRSLEPLLHEGVYVYCVVPHGANLNVSPVATVQEAEGVTLILAEEQAGEVGLPILFRASWITLTVQSDLQAVGLTAAFSTALGRAGISCNVVAGAFHDHIFVPVELAQQAIEVLQALQEKGGV